MYSSKILLLIFMFVAVLFGTVNTEKTICGNTIGWLNNVLFAIGVVGTIAYYI